MERLDTQNKSRFKAIAGAFICHSIWGGSFVFTKLGLPYCLPMQFIGIRFGLAALALLLLQITGLIKIRLRLADLPFLLSQALLEPVIYFLFETYGLAFGAASEGALFLATTPVFVIFFSAIILKEYIKPVQAVFLITSVSGVIFITLMDGFAGGDMTSKILFVGAVFTATTYVILTRHLGKRFSALQSTYIMMMTGAVVFNIIGIGQFWGQNNSLIGYLAPLAQPEALISLLYLALLASILAFFLSNYSLRNLPPFQVSVFSNYATVVTVLVSMALLKERLIWWHWLGIAVIMIGVIGTNYFQQSAKTRLVKNKRMEDG